MLERPVPTLELVLPSVKWGSRTRAGRQPPGDTSPRATPISRWPETVFGHRGPRSTVSVFGLGLADSGSGARARALGSAGPLNETGAKREARRRVCSCTGPSRLRLLVCPGKRALAARAHQSLDRLAFDLDGRLLKVRAESAMRADLVHPGRLRVEAVHGNLAANGAGSRHSALSNTCSECTAPTGT